MFAYQRSVRSVEDRKHVEQQCKNLQIVCKRKHEPKRKKKKIRNLQRENEVTTVVYINNSIFHFSIYTNVFVINLKIHI